MTTLRVGILLLLAATASAGGVDFSADIKKVEGEDRVAEGTLHVKGGVYRPAFPDPKGPDGGTMRVST